MGTEWFKDWFNNPEYLALYKHRDKHDAKKIISLLFKHIRLPAGSKCLDLACGNGRHSVLFARKGYNVTGLDLSPFLINEANKRLKTEYKEYKNRLNFVIKDMRNIGFVNEFSLVVNLFTSFGYFNTRNENFRVIKQVSGALKTGGYFLFDFLNKEHLIKTLVPFNIKKLNGSVFMQVRYIEKSAVKKDIIIIEPDSKGKTSKVHQFLEKIQLYSVSDFKKVFKKNGLKVIKLFGSYKGEKYYQTSSERLIILAQKS
jgi:SAM-dependent methyltransferase